MIPKSSHIADIAKTSLMPFRCRAKYRSVSVDTKGGDKMFDKIITLVSVSVSGVAVLVTLFQIHKDHSLEKEKIRLEIYSKFIAFCQKKASGTSTPEDDFELMKVHSQLMLVTDHKLNNDITDLYNHLFSEPRSVTTIQLLDKVSQDMWLRMKSFNRPRFYRPFRRR